LASSTSWWHHVEVPRATAFVIVRSFGRYNSSYRAHGPLYFYMMDNRGLKPRWSNTRPVSRTLTYLKPTWLNKRWLTHLDYRSPIWKPDLKADSNPISWLTDLAIVLVLPTDSRVTKQWLANKDDRDILRFTGCVFRIIFATLNSGNEN
jgi:hypothetical protein